MVEREGPSTIEKLNKLSMGADVVTVGFGILTANAPVVFFGVLSFMTGDVVSRELKKRRES